MRVRAIAMKIDNGLARFASKFKGKSMRVTRQQLPEFGWAI